MSNKLHVTKVMSNIKSAQFLADNEEYQDTKCDNLF